MTMTASQQTEQALLKKADAAKALSIGLRTLDRMIATRAIRVVRIRRNVRVPMTEIERIARGEGRVGGVTHHHH